MLRVVSAAALIAVLIGVIWFLPLWATAVLAAVASGLAAGELARLAARTVEPVPAVFVSLAAAALTIAFVAYDSRVPGSQADSLGAVLLALVVVSGVMSLAAGPPSPAALTRAAVLIMAPIYVGLPLGAIVWIQLVFGPRTTTWLLAMIAVSDSAQYYSGRLVGRRKLAPAISPSKTVEGALGGLVAVAIIGFVTGPLGLPDFSRPACAGLALVLAVFGMAGDLFESLLKRSVGAKDSSALIPGHGGVLDRIDSHLFAAPIFYLFLRYAA